MARQFCIKPCIATLLGIVMGMLASMGCGTGGNNHPNVVAITPAPTTEAVTHVKLTGRANKSQGTVLKTITDSADLTCAFSFDSTSTTTGISVVAAGHTSDCVSANKCITCVTTSGRGCSINCSGNVPSSVDTANDSITIYAVFTSTLKTNMTSPAGMIHVAARATNWDEFLFTATGGVQEDLSGCQGQGTYDLSITNDTTFSDVGAHTADVGWPITTLKPDGDGVSHCELTTRFKAVMPFTGAATPGATIDLSRGSIQYATKVCDVAGASANDPDCIGGAFNSLIAVNLSKSVGTVYSKSNSGNYINLGGFSGLTPAQNSGSTYALRDAALEKAIRWLTE